MDERKISGNFRSFGSFKWTKPREKAAALVAEDSLTDEQIAEKVGVDSRTLRNWKQHTEFRGRVQSHVEEFRRRIMETGIAVKANRIASLNRRWEGLHQVIAERAIDMEGECPGGSTGLVVRKTAFVKVLEAKTTVSKDIEEFDLDEFFPTKQSQLVYEYAVDTGTLAEIRQVEMQAAKDLGQLVEKHEVETRDTTARESLKRKLVSVAATVRTDEVSGESDG